MWINGRRVVDLRLWHSAQEERAALVSERDALKIENAELKRQNDWILRELEDITEQFRQLKAAVLARQRAAVELAELYRQREIARAQAVERDPTLPLQ
jgi:hypothetical protein